MSGSNPLDTGSHYSNPAFTTEILRSVLDEPEFHEFKGKLIPDIHNTDVAAFMVLQVPPHSDLIALRATYLAFRGYFTDLSGKNVFTAIVAFKNHGLISFGSVPLHNLGQFRDFLRALKGPSRYASQILAIIDQLKSIAESFTH